MVVHPLLEEKAQGAEGVSADEPNTSERPVARSEASEGYGAQRDIPRKLDIYAASAGYELRNELDFLSKRTIEPNIFIMPVFWHLPCRGWKTASFVLW